MCDGELEVLRGLLDRVVVLPDRLDHLPDVEPGAQERRAPARGSVAKPDQWMAVHADALFDVPLDESGLRGANFVCVIAKKPQRRRLQTGAERFLVALFGIVILCIAF